MSIEIKERKKFLKPRLHFLNNKFRSKQLLVSIDLKSFTIARINSMSTKLERLPIVQLQVAHSILFLIDRPDQKWARCKRGFITLYPVSRVHFTRTLSIYGSVIFSFSLSSFLFPWSETRTSNDSFRLYRENRFIRNVHKNHKIRFFDPRHRDPWDISWIDVASRTINERFRSLASCR